MRRFVGGLAATVGLFVLACASAPAAQPAQPAAAPAAAPAAPAAKPAPAAQPAKPAAPAAQPAAAAKRQLAPGFEVDQALLDAAKKEGKVVFWGALTEQDNKLMGAKFEELTGIAVETVRLSAGPQFTRITKEREAKLYTVDVISHGDVGLWQIHKQKKNVISYMPEGAKKYAPEFRDKDGAYFPIWVIPMAIGYNSKLITGADIPKRYADLAEPKYKGKVATAHPKHSGTGNELVIILTNTLGWGYYEKLKQNELFIVRSQLELNPIAATGERPLSIGAVDSAFLADKRAGKPLELVYPDDGTAVALSVSGVVNDAPHPNAGKLFQEWLHSQAGQTLLASQMYMVPHPDAVYPAGRRTLKEIKTIALSADEVEKKSQPTRERFSDLFGG